MRDETEDGAMDRNVTRKTAVVADDDPDVRQVVVEYLESAGFAVTEAVNGLEALMYVKRLQPDLLLLDIMMPRLGGIEALAHIRKRFPGVNVLVVTGVRDDALRGRALALGAAAVLPKPLDLASLGAMIASATPLSVDAKAAVPDARRPAHVLVVDDDPQMREVLEEFLRAQGYTTSIAEDGLAALRAIIDETPDVVLLDITMPHLNGIEALAAIRAIAATTAVIMVSGTEQVETARRALSHGAFDYVKKPMDLGYLAGSIEAALLTRTLAAPLEGRSAGSRDRALFLEISS